MGYSENDLLWQRRVRYREGIALRHGLSCVPFGVFDGPRGWRVRALESDFFHFPFGLVMSLRAHPREYCVDVIHARSTEGPHTYSIDQVHERSNRERLASRVEGFAAACALVAPVLVALDGARRLAWDGSTR